MALKRPKKQDRNSFTRRAFILGGAQAAAFGVLGWRLFDLQVTQQEQYSLLSDENRISLRLTAPVRGIIYDRFGEKIASSKRNLRIIMIPEEVQDIPGSLSALQKMITVGEKDRSKVEESLKTQPKFRPITITEHLSWEDFSNVSVRSTQMSGFYPDVGSTRLYHKPIIFSHVLGHVGAVNEHEVGEDPVLMLPGFQIGKNGVEKAYEKNLRGAPGNRRVEVNAQGREVRALSQDPATSGQDIVLGVDARIQQTAMERLSGESGAAVAIDIRSGDVLALASAPGFDPREFVVGIGQESWEALLSDPLKPLSNKAVRGQYPPGSVYKMVVAAAAIEHGVIGVKDKIRCSGAYHLGSHRFHCWKRRGHGRVDMHYAIKQSCDVYFYEIAQRLGVDRIADMAKKLGLGQNYNIDMPGAKSGVVPSKSWKEDELAQPWYPGETLVSGIGQGYVLATPLQIAVLAARIASGREVSPRMARQVGYGEIEHKQFAPLNVSEEALEIVRAGMAGVVNEPGGTGRRSMIDVAGQRMAGKTGTSQVRRITRAERSRGVKKNKDLPWHLRDHAVFMCFAPVVSPRYAVSVLVEHGGGGSRAAAPVAKDIMLALLKHDPARKAPFTLKPKQGEPTRRADINSEGADQERRNG